MLLVGAVILAILVVPWPWSLVLVAGAAVGEVAESILWIKLSRRRPPQTGREALLGAEAVVVSPCRPEGQVRVDGELWHARCERGAEPGERVLVRAVDGLTLLVE